MPRSMFSAQIRMNGQTLFLLPYTNMKFNSLMLMEKTQVVLGLLILAESKGERLLTLVKKTRCFSNRT